jgi:hypothetical protein
VFSLAAADQPTMEDFADELLLVGKAKGSLCTRTNLMETKKKRIKRNQSRRLLLNMF